MSVNDKLQPQSATTPATPRDNYVDRTHAVIARASFYSAAAYVLLAELAQIAGAALHWQAVPPIPDWEIIVAILSPALSFLGVDLLTVRKGKPA
ncbi:hypothetical protein SNT97_001341 [Salmonella enterica]|nr:hypothetical protein [Salmonella enterica subsp. enterica serovar Wangata]EGA9536946.1 hypothetical protein [Salmonella enterica]ELU0790713.1 hypothetical protein [Salmonella enterica]ELY7574974.1 hypothetical protein [Salmonella enterica]